MKELGHENRHLDYLKVDTDKGDNTGFEDVVSLGSPVNIEFCFLSALTVIYLCR